MTAPRIPLFQRKAKGLTGADLEQAKAAAAMTAADKAHDTAKALAFQLFPATGADDALHASYAPMQDAASNLANIAAARNPEGAARGDSAVADLRARLARLRRP